MKLTDIITLVTMPFKLCSLRTDCMLTPMTGFCPNLVYTSSKQERLTRISVHSYQEWSKCAKKVTVIASMPLPKRKLRR